MPPEPPFYFPLALETQTFGFSIRNAQSLALASSWAYTKSPTVVGPKSDDQAIFFDAGPAYVLAFMGTRDLRQWLLDFKALQRKIPGGKAHDGLCHGMDDLIENIFATVKAAPGLILNSAPVPKPLFITGHSRGGGLAELCAYLFVKQGLPVRAVYTYGGMRWANHSLAGAYNELLGDRTWRIVLPFDIVPHMPLTGWLLKYWHTMQEVFWRGGGVFNRTAARKFLMDAIMFYQAWKHLRNLQALDLWEDVKKEHGISNYIMELGTAGTPASGPAAPPLATRHSQLL